MTCPLMLCWPSEIRSLCSATETYLFMVFPVQSVSEKLAPPELLTGLAV